MTSASGLLKYLFLRTLMELCRTTFAGSANLVGEHQMAFPRVVYLPDFSKLDVYEARLKGADPLPATAHFSVAMPAMKGFAMSSSKMVFRLTR